MSRNFTAAARSSPLGPSAPPTERDWRAALGELEIENAVLIAVSHFDLGRRTYRANGLAYKVVLSAFETTSAARQQTLVGELELLKRCNGIFGVPSAMEYRSTEHAQALAMSFIEGQSLAGFTASILDWLRLWLRLGLLLARVSIRGVSHNDVLPENVVVTSRMVPHVLDYDQAMRTTRFRAFIRNFFGLRLGGAVTHGSMLMMFRRVAGPHMPRQLNRLLRKLARRPRGAPAPALPPDASSKLRKLDVAWRVAAQSRASSPGSDIAYYSIDVDGVHFPGERNWENRWTTLREIRDYSGARILELGCNMALLSTFLLRDEGVSEALAVDRDPQILKSARLVSEAFGVALETHQADFDDLGHWENRLRAFVPDVVFALNVLNWVSDKERLLRFLGESRVLVFEGHRDARVESEELRRLGFSTIELVGYSERGRAILHCMR